MGTSLRHPHQRSKNVGARTSRRLKEQPCCTLNRTRTHQREQQEQTTALQLTGARDSVPLRFARVIPLQWRAPSCDVALTLPSSRRGNSLHQGSGRKPVGHSCTHTDAHSHPRIRTAGHTAHTHTHTPTTHPKASQQNTPTPQVPTRALCTFKPQ